MSLSEQVLELRGRECSVVILVLSAQRLSVSEAEQVPPCSCDSESLDGTADTCMYCFSVALLVKVLFLLPPPLSSNQKTIHPISSTTPHLSTKSQSLQPSSTPLPQPILTSITFLEMLAQSPLTSSLEHRNLSKCRVGHIVAVLTKECYERKARLRK